TSLEMSSSPVPTVLLSGADSVLCSSDEHKASSCASIASNLAINLCTPESSRVSSCTRLSDETYTTSQNCMLTVVDNNGESHHAKLLVDHTIMVNLSAFEVKAAWATGHLNAAAEAATTIRV
ncbi:hypothetical protein K439DRAFT_1640416, partial [Ramaria rubella]